MMDLVKEAGLESPSKEFTKNVMAHLKPKTETTAVVYRPLIGKTTWIVIGLLALAVLLFVFFVPVGALPMANNLFDGISLELGNGWQPELSKTSMYALGCMALFLVQIPFLKRYLEQRV